VARSDSKRSSGIFQTSMLPAMIARSNMVLVPKISEPKKVTYFRPISVCNVLYKVISKILCNRLKPYISQLVGNNQNAFIPGRDIADNVILMREVVHFLRSSRFKHNIFCLKCDLSKAFDRIRWDFIISVLRCYGFPAVYIHWISFCLSSASFTILFNGRGDGFIKPSRGLRQGCAMSPYLFVLVMDVLFKLLNFQVHNGAIKRLRLARKTSILTNIMFADDLIFLCRA
jgi:Reverse transcriptase (RNA-dependent DNA polymerase)